MNDDRKRILIVDDEPDHRLLLGLLLLEVWSLDVTLTEADNGKDTVFLAKVWQPHLILMDLKMPLLDGYETIRQIRTLEKKQSTKVNSMVPYSHPIHIIVVTAAVSQCDRQQAFAAGCNDFIGKPFQFEQLYQSVIEHCYGMKQGYSDASLRNLLCKVPLKKHPQGFAIK